MVEPLELGITPVQGAFCYLLSFSEKSKNKLKILIN